MRKSENSHACICDSFQTENLVFLILERPQAITKLSNRLDYDLRAEWSCKAFSVNTIDALCCKFKVMFYDCINFFM